MKRQLPFTPPQLQNYMDACWIEGYFTKKEVAQISNIYEKKQKKEAKITGGKALDPDFRKSSVTFIEPDNQEFRSIMLKLSHIALKTNQHRFHFDLSGFYESIQIAEYGEGGFFDWHADFGNGHASNRKLSLSVQLSEPNDYEGGNLQFMMNEKGIDAPRTIGTIVIFPSFVLHRVTPITRGTRRSLVGWVTGMPFK